MSRLWRTDGGRRKVENRAVFCWTRNRNIFGHNWFLPTITKVWHAWTTQSFLGIRKLARCAKLCQLVLFPEKHLSLASLLPCLALLSRLSHNEKWIYHWVHKRMETMYILNCTKPNVFLAVHKTHLKNLCNFFSSNLKMNFRHWKIHVTHTNIRAKNSLWIHGEGTNKAILGSSETVDITYCSLLHISRELFPLWKVSRLIWLWPAAGSVI